MKLGEALNQRSALQQRIGEIRARLGEIAVTVEGDEHEESVEQLLTEHDDANVELTRLIASINRRNLATVLGDATLMDALARREQIGRQIKTLDGVIAASEVKKQYRSLYGSGQGLKFIRHVNVADTRTKRQNLAKELRELDARIQELNWSTEL